MRVADHPGRPQLQGSAGTVCGFDPATGEWEVRLLVPLASPRSGEGRALLPDAAMASFWLLRCRQVAQFLERQF